MTIEELRQELLRGFARLEGMQGLMTPREVLLVRMQAKYWHQATSLELERLDACQNPLPKETR